MPPGATKVGEVVEAPRRLAAPPQPVERLAVAVPAAGDHRARVVRERGRAGREDAAGRRHDPRRIGAPRATTGAPRAPPTPGFSAPPPPFSWEAGASSAASAVMTVAAPRRPMSAL